MVRCEWGRYIVLQYGAGCMLGIRHCHGVLCARRVPMPKVVGCTTVPSAGCPLMATTCHSAALTASPVRSCLCATRPGVHSAWRIVRRAPAPSESRTCRRPWSSSGRGCAGRGCGRPLGVRVQARRCESGRTYSDPRSACPCVSPVYLQRACCGRAGSPGHLCGTLCRAARETNAERLHRVPQWGMHALTRRCHFLSCIPLTLCPPGSAGGMDPHVHSAGQQQGQAACTPAPHRGACSPPAAGGRRPA